MAARDGLILADDTPCQIHNNCSGKHCGFLTVAQHMGAGPEYLEIDHPTCSRLASLHSKKRPARPAPAYGIDGCSAPNFATSLVGLARSMAWFASAADRSDRASDAAQQLTAAMIKHPELVAGENPRLHRVDARHEWPRRDQNRGRGRFRGHHTGKAHGRGAEDHRRHHPRQRMRHRGNSGAAWACWRPSTRPLANS